MKKDEFSNSQKFSNYIVFKIIKMQNNYEIHIKNTKIRKFIKAQLTQLIKLIKETKNNK